MRFPPFVYQFPELDIPFPDTAVRSHAVRSDAGLVAFFTFLQDVELPPHSHGAQWGIVAAGQLTLTMNGQTKSYTSGDSYYVPPGVEHAVHVTAGTIVLDVFEETDRYPIRERFDLAG